MDLITLQDLATLVQGEMVNREVLELKIEYRRLDDNDTAVGSFLIYGVDPDGGMIVDLYYLDSPCSTDVIVESLSEYFKDQLNIIVGCAEGRVPEITILNMDLYEYVGISKSVTIYFNDISVKCSSNKRQFFVRFRQSNGTIHLIKTFNIRSLSQHNKDKINTYVGIDVDQSTSIVDLVTSNIVEFEIPKGGTKQYESHNITGFGNTSTR